MSEKYKPVPLSAFHVAKNAISLLIVKFVCDVDNIQNYILTSFLSENKIEIICMLMPC